MSNDEETKLTREKRAGVLLIGAAQLMEEAANVVGLRSVARDLRSRAERTAGEGVRMTSDAEALLKELREAQSADGLRDELVRAQAEARGWKVRAQRAEERAAAAEEKAAQMAHELDAALAELDRLSGTSTALADAIAAEQRAAAAEEKAAQMGEHLAAIMAECTAHQMAAEKHRREALSATSDAVEQRERAERAEGQLEAIRSAARMAGERFLGLLRGTGGQ